MSPSVAPERVNVLGFPVDRVTMSETTELLTRFLESEGTKLVLTADANAFVCAQTDPNFQRIFSQASLITPDSAGPVWALERYGKPVPKRVSGVDIVEELCKISEAKGARLFFLGAGPGVADQAASNLKAKFPKCQIVGVRDGFFGELTDEQVARQIAELEPDVLLVGMGMPRQELFILNTADIIKAKIGIGVGGSFDVHSGTVKRAPMIFQKLRLEWLWRILLNPKKIAKVKNLPIFYWQVRRATK